MKMRLLHFISAVLLVVILLQPVSAEQYWKEKQQALFDKYDIKDGDVFDSSNCDKIKSLLPEPIFNWVKKGEWTIPIGEMEYDFGTDPAWIDDRNAGKFKLGDKDQVIEIATGKYPTHSDGIPFPISTIDFSDTRTAAIKIINNSMGKSPISSPIDRGFYQEWIGQKGYEKCISGSLQIMVYVTEGNNLKEIYNPNQFAVTSLIKIEEPYDVAGTCVLSWRYFDLSEDVGFTYLPIIRRVKRNSQAQRSDSNMGTDFALDDQDCFNGRIDSMNWDLIDEQDFLMPVMGDSLNRIEEYKEFPDGSWRPAFEVDPMINGYMDPEWKGAPWAPMNVKWILRDCWVLELYPKDEYYNYGRQLLYIDKRNLSACFKVIYDRSGKYWKTIMTLYSVFKGKGGLVNTTSTMYLGVDDKAHHASTGISAGTYTGGSGKTRKFKAILFSPYVKPGIFSPQNLSRIAR
jgi:hypothetical protein